jgi:hypothetical protein
LRKWTDRYDPADGLLYGGLQILDGHNEEGLKTLLAEMGGPHQSIWWLYELDPVLAPVRTDPRFKAAMAAQRKYAAQQRQLIEQMQARGEIPRR